MRIEVQILIFICIQIYNHTKFSLHKRIIPTIIPIDTHIRLEFYHFIGDFHSDKVA